MKSLRVRLSVFLLAALLLAACAIGVVTYRNTLRENEELFDYQLRQIALSLRDQPLLSNPTLPYGSGEDTGDVVVQIWTFNGTVLYLSHPGDALPDQAKLGFSDVIVGNRRWRVYSMAARDRVVQVAQPVELRRDLAASAALRSLAPLLGFAPLMALLIWSLVGNGLSSLKRLARDVRQRDAGVLDDVSEADVPTEMAPLVHSLNGLLARLRKAFASQRAFVADAAHELRSPLTALKLQLQLLGRAQDDAARALALEKLHEGVDRATRLIEQLLTAARSEEGAGTAFGTVDLAEVTRQAIGDVFIMAQERGIEIGLDAAGAGAVCGDAASLHILARNLLDNAVRYTPRGGTVQAAVKAMPDG
ncbi:MAG: histidine kinase dimerization/phospho-acceptor domain-containing protein, partial [Burkholderiaceae bacterium]